jgi:hypothetical protein
MRSSGWKSIASSKGPHALGTEIAHIRRQIQARIR